MAAKFQTTVFVCFAVLQVVMGQTALSCTVQVQQLQSDLAAIAKQASLDITLARAAINRSITSSRQNINAQLSALQLKANLALGPNAVLCKIQLQADLTLLNTGLLNLCNANVDLNALNQQVNQINVLKNSANQICTICLSDNTCVNNQIEALRSQAQAIQQGISSGAADVQQKSADCVAQTEKGQLDIINTASVNLDACLSA